MGGCVLWWETHLMGPRRIRKLLSAALLLLGLLWVMMCLFSVVFFWEGDGRVGYVLQVSLCLMTCVPGLMFFESGFRLWREMRLKYLAKGVGALCVFGVFFLSSLMSFLFEKSEVRMSLMLLCSAVLMVPVFLGMMRFLYGSITGEWRGLGDFIGRGMLGWISLLVWMNLSQLVEFFVGESEQSGFEAMLQLVMPVGLTWFFYGVTVRCFVRGWDAEGEELRNL